MRPFFVWLSLALLFTGCASPNGRLHSHLTRSEVKKIATDRLKENRIVVSPEVTWKISLSVDEDPALWTVMTQEPNRPPPGYWLLIEDRRGGKADFLFPQLGMVKPPAGSDWLQSVQSALRQVSFPIELEVLLEKLHVEGTSMDSGGTIPGGRMYIEGTLRWLKQGTPERFDIRCYIVTPDGWAGRKIVTGVELSYIDNLINRYLLTDGNR